MKSLFFICLVALCLLNAAIATEESTEEKPETQLEDQVETNEVIENVKETSSK